MVAGLTRALSFEFVPPRLPRGQEIHSTPSRSSLATRPTPVKDEFVLDFRSLHSTLVANKDGSVLDCP